MSETVALRGNPAIRVIWLAVATGGWWKPRELAESLKMDLRDVHSRLQCMRKSGYLVHRKISSELIVRNGRGRPECVEFAISNDSVVPAGLTAKQVLEALKGTSA